MNHRKKINRKFHQELPHHNMTVDCSKFWKFVCGQCLLLKNTSCNCTFTFFTSKADQSRTDCCSQYSSHARNNSQHHKVHVYETWATAHQEKSLTPPGVVLWFIRPVRRTSKRFSWIYENLRNLRSGNLWKSLPLHASASHLRQNYHSWDSEGSCSWRVHHLHHQKE